MLTKTSSVLLTLISLFSNIELTPQNFQPMYIALGLDMAVLFLVIGPCATLYGFFTETIAAMLKMRTKASGAIEMYEQEDTEAISKLKTQFMYIDHFASVRSLCPHEMGCSFEVYDYMRIVLDFNMYKGWFYSFLATLPPAILKLAIDKFFTSTGFVKW